MSRTIPILCLLFLTCTTRAAAIPDYPFVFVTGESEAHVVPDVVACSVTVRVFDTDPSKAQKLVERRLQDLLMFLSERKVPAEDIEAYDVQKEIIASDSSDPGRVTIRGYNISRAINFKLRDVALWPEISAMLLSTENMDELHVNFDRTDRDKIAADLIAKAAADAKSKASQLAQSFGRSLGAAVAISQESFGFIDSRFGFGGGGGMGAASPSVSIASMPPKNAMLLPTTIPVNARVNALFKLD
jgi:uncharacterized protein YggE